MGNANNLEIVAVESVTGWYSFLYYLQFMAFPKKSK